MTKTDKTGSKPPRPFSISAKDFLKGASEEQRRAATASSPAAPPVDEEEEEAPAPSFRRPDVAPSGSAGRASTHSRPPAPSEARKAPQRKDEHTILMAVPPPAQENTGKKS